MRKFTAGLRILASVFVAAVTVMRNGYHRATVFGRASRSLLLGLVFSLCSVTAAAGPPWLLVDTQAQTLVVMAEDEPLLTLHNLSVGRYGVTSDKRRGDNMTPLGQFRVTQVKRDSAFYRFIALSYPDAERAERGRQNSEISATQLRAILAAHERGKAPPQGTPLGGHIGIHGLGQADPTLHQMMNWTRGCIAVTDRQLDSLLPWVQRGMLVEIR